LAVQSPLTAQQKDWWADSWRRDSSPPCHGWGALEQGTWCFLDGAIGRCQNAHCPRQTFFFFLLAPPLLAVCVSATFSAMSICFFRAWVLLQRHFFFNVLLDRWIFFSQLRLGAFELSKAYLSSPSTDFWKNLISAYITLFLHLDGNVDFSTNIPMWNSDLIPCAYQT